MEQLLEDYKRKLETIKQMIADDNGESESTLDRLKIKQGMIRSFIVDIERAMADANTGGQRFAFTSVNESALRKEFKLGYKAAIENLMHAYRGIFDEHFR